MVLRTALACTLVLVVGLGVVFLYLDLQVGPMLCASSGNMGAPAPTPPPPGPCPSGLGGASDPRVTLVDDWSVGTERSCAGDECVPAIDAATEGLAGRDPGHPAVVRVTVHDDGLYPCRNTNDLIQVFRSGGFPTIVLFELADGSRRAIGVVPGGPQFSLSLPRDRGPGPQQCTRTEPHPTT